MATSMGPPPPRVDTTSISGSTSEDDAPSSASQLQSHSEAPSLASLCTEGTNMKTPMGPPPGRNPNSLEPDSASSQITTSTDEIREMDLIHLTSTETPLEGSNNGAAAATTDWSQQPQTQNIVVPYTIPPWSEAPSHPFSLEVIKDGAVIDQLDVTEKGAYMFGRVDLCDFVLEHPTISRFHAVLQFKGNGDVYLYDIGSTHGTFINKKEVKKKVYVELHVGDVIRFGHSSRLYIVQGPAELMPPEKDMKHHRSNKLTQEMQDREASLRRARENAALADGISWGMGEDAIEEDEDDSEEITWQTYKGELTEKQEKTRSKVLKRMEKIGHMKKEIDAIRVKDIAQGGLTQGQQTQIARNEQRISQILEELESLEETLNDSIQESVGARAGKFPRGKRREAPEEDDLPSDDDEFYDRTKKKSSATKLGNSQSVETADTLLDKKGTITKEMEEKRKMLADEKTRILECKVEPEPADALDAYMSGLSTQLVVDKTAQLEEELSTLQTELDRILYLLKVADPTGEAARKREATAQEPKSKESEPPSAAVKSTKKPLVVDVKSTKKPPIVAAKSMEKSSIEEKDSKGLEKSCSHFGNQEALDVIEKTHTVNEAAKDVKDAPEGKTPVYTALKPQWLGAVAEKEEENRRESLLGADENDQFVDYKDRKKILNKVENPGLEDAAPGLIIRKKQQVGNTDSSDTEGSKQAAGADTMAMDAVALLLKHKRGYIAVDDERDENLEGPGSRSSKQDNKKPKKVLGPEKPSFLEEQSDYDSWMPPDGQSGDGRTSLNDRLGY